MLRAPASLVFLLTVLSACDDPPALPEAAAATRSRFEMPPPDPRAALPAPMLEIRQPAEQALRARWSPAAQQILGDAFAAILGQDEVGVRVELELEPDRSAIDRVARGEAALAIVAAEINAHDLQRGLEATACGRYVPVLVVNESNPLRGLNARAMREAVTGQARSWLALGGRSAGAVELAVPEATALRQRAAALLVPGDRFAGDAAKLTSDRAVLDFVRARPNALGLVSAAALADGRTAGGVRALAIDGALPGNDGYRWQTPLMVVARERRDALTERVLARVRRVRT